MARLRILHAIHDFLPKHRAGSEVYALELCKALAVRHDVWVLCAECDPSRPHATLTWRVHDGLPVVELVNNWAFRSFEETYRPPQLNDALRHVLGALQPDVLHIHSLLNLSMDLPALGRARGIPSVATLHDYTLVCPSGGQRVHVAESHVCTEIDTSRCARCFPSSPFHAQMTMARFSPGRARPVVETLGRALRRRVPWLFGWMEEAVRRTPAVSLGPHDVDRRLEQARRVFDNIGVFVAPSAALGREFTRLGLPAEKIRVSDYGMRPFQPVPRRPHGGRLRVGFVGTPVWHKGAHVLLEAVSQLPSDRVEVKLFGDLEAFPSYVRALRSLARGQPVQFMGPFDADRFAEVYGAIDVLVVPSLWPENSPLVIHEAFQAGVPVVGSRQGGVPELVSHDVNGLLFDAWSVPELARVLQTLIDEPGRLERYARAIPAVKTIADDARGCEAMYRQVLERRLSPPTVETDAR